MKNKKLLALGLVLAMTASLFSACGKTDEKESSEKSKETSKVSEEKESSEASDDAAEEEKKEITFPLEESVKFDITFFDSQDTYLLKDNTCLNLMLEKWNIEMDIQQFAAAEAGEKWNLMLAGGDYPEAFWKANILDCDKYGMEGIFIPLEDIIREYMPNLTAHLDERDGWKEITAPDGHIYSLPNISKSLPVGTANAVFWLNTVWLDNLGLEMPDSMEELYEVLKAFKEQDANGNGDPNDEIPWMAEPGTYRWLQKYMGESMHVSDHVVDKDGEILYYPTTDECYNWLEWMTRFYEEGLIYKDSFTITTDQAKAIGVQADVLGMYCVSYTNGWVPVENELDYRPIMPFDEDKFALTMGIYKEGMAITDKCENPEILCAAFDYFYSEEGGLMCRMGLEGDSYVINDDGSYSWIWKEKYEHTRQYELCGGGTVPIYNPDFEYTMVNKEANPAQWLSNQNYAEGGVFKVGKTVPTITFTAEEDEELSAIATDLAGYVGNYYAEVITGIQDLESTWDEFQETLKQMGAEDYIRIYKDAYTRVTAE